MFVALGTLLGQVTRSKSALVLCEVSTYDIAKAAVEAAAASRQPLVLIHPVGGATYTAEHEAFLSWLHWVAEHAPTSIAIGAVVSPENVHAVQLIKQLPGVTVFIRGEGSLETIATQIQALGLSNPVIDVTVAATPQSLAWFAEQTGAVALRMPLPQGRTGALPSTPVYLAHVRKVVKVPLLGQEAGFSPALLKKCVTAGLRGVTLKEALTDAYTAGLRTGLRSRSVHDPAVYAKPAHVAVCDRVRSFHRYLAKKQ